MIESMTGFSSREAKIHSLGRVCVQLRSTNHKFLEVVFHLPEGFLSLEDKIRKEIEAKIKRGRLICLLTVALDTPQEVFVNRELVKKYFSVIQTLQKAFGLKNEISVDTLIHLPGVLSLAENKIPAETIWPSIKKVVEEAVEHLARTRQKEGKALHGHLKVRIKTLESSLVLVEARFKRAIAKKLPRLESDEERTSFLKNSDITEELERLTFHAQSFSHKLSSSAPVGKELDFIAQEMQREANTIGAKSCDKLISGRVVQIKSLIEKLREQVQNVE